MKRLPAREDCQCSAPEVVQLWSWTCDEQELPRRHLGDGDLSEDSPRRRQHVADVGLTHLENPGERWAIRTRLELPAYHFCQTFTRVVYLRHGVSKQPIQQLVRVLPLHDELAERCEVDNSHLLHDQFALSANRPEPVGTFETGPAPEKPVIVDHCQITYFNFFFRVSCI